jgi:hypothetical protein
LSTWTVVYERTATGWSAYVGGVDVGQVELPQLA